MTTELKPAVSVDDFDGLRLSVPPALVGADGASDLLDVDWDARGVLGSRMGVVEYTTEEATENYDVIFGAGQPIAPLGESLAILARRGETLVIVGDEGKEEGATIEVSTGRLNFVQMGLGALTPVTYIANQNNPVRKFDGSEFSSPSATVDGVEGKTMPAGHFVADWQDGANRLVVANTALDGGPGEASGSPAHVFFSEPGKPEHYESTAFVELNPGDGQQIIGMCTWGRQVFVFKETYCFVFYGISADSEGKPIFNFQTVDLGTRALGQRGSGPPHVIAGRDGVYFLAHDGVYVTSGGLPTRITDNLDFSAQRRDARTELGGMTFPTWRQAKGLCIVGDSLYVGMPEEGGEGAIPVKRLLKIDLLTGRTTYWKTELFGFMSFALAAWSEGTERLFCSGAAEDKKGIYYYSPDTDEDALVEPSPYWHSGRYDVGNPDEKTLTLMKMWGTGEVDVAVAEDYGELGEAKTFKLGTDAIAQSQQQRGQSATLFSHRLSGAAPWSVQRLTRYLRETRVPATEKQS